MVVSIVYLITWLSQVLSFLLLTMLSNKLSANDFGFVTLSLLILGLAQKLNEFGINEYYVLNGDKTKLPTLFWMNLIKLVDDEY